MLCYLHYSCNNTRKKRGGLLPDQNYFAATKEYLEKIVLQAELKYMLSRTRSRKLQLLNFIVVWPRYRLPTEIDKRIRIQ